MFVLILVNNLFIFSFFTLNVFHCRFLRNDKIIFSVMIFFNKSIFILSGVEICLMCVVFRFSAFSVLVNVVGSC